MTIASIYGTEIQWTDVAKIKERLLLEPKVGEINQTEVK
jgi:hypothetical protein